MNRSIFNPSRKQVFPSDIAKISEALNVFDAFSQETKARMGIHGYTQLGNLLGQFDRMLKEMNNEQQKEKK